MVKVTLEGAFGLGLDNVQAVTKLANVKAKKCFLFIEIKKAREFN
ncbi:hypothetical protein CWATWH8502_2897 [Crocosphaera watsonii WH 8502]|uniref:Uncharacterized protein n=1 Tax=Crocosphaera watsonii WH 8502 TaxID=423474 RepID=T2ICF8_CROWT|nr:hypothetical protein CWATWH8502_2897 [Crocosphaera watsonii WH 8502]